MDFRTGAGKQRQTFRILEWLHRKGIKQGSIAAELGISCTLVSDTIRGRRNNRRVLRILVERGCPITFLSLPSDVAPRHAA